MWPFTKKTEKRASGSGYTADIMAARESYISGRQGIGELTATVQSCITLWESGLSLADIEGTDLLKPQDLALAARSLALRGEALFLIDGSDLIACSDWELTTNNAKPKAYRIGISEAGGGISKTALAGEVLHFRIGADSAAPYYGTAPLKRAQLTAGLLNAIESVLSEVYEVAPIGSQIVPMPEMPDADMQGMARGFRGNRGRVLIRESVNVSAAGGPAPQQDWKASNVTPDISKAMTKESLEAARGGISMVYGVLPAFHAISTTGPLVREAQRHLAQWMLQPIANMMAQEASEKLASKVTLDVMRPLQAYDAGGRARAAMGTIKALAEAKEAGIDPALALHLVDWKE